MKTESALRSGTQICSFNHDFDTNDKRHFKRKREGKVRCASKEPPLNTSIYRSSTSEKIRTRFLTTGKSSINGC